MLSLSCSSCRLNFELKEEFISKANFMYLSQIGCICKSKQIWIVSCIMSSIDIYLTNYVSQKACNERQQRLLLFLDDIIMKSKIERYSSNSTPSPCFQCLFKLLLHKYFIWKKQQNKNVLVTFVTSCTTHIGKICKLSNVVFSIRNT